MSIRELTEQIAVKISCKESCGSGCLIVSSSPEYDYIITALHCLEGKNEPKQEYTIHDIVIQRGDVVFNVIKEYKHSAEDLVLLTVQKCDGLFATHMLEVDIDDRIIISGYPGVLENRNISVVSLEGKFIQKNDNIHVVKINEELATFDSRAINQIEGLSGAGTFFYRGNKIGICGILCELSTPDFAYRLLNIIPIEKVHEIITLNNLSAFKHVIAENETAYGSQHYDDSLLDPIHIRWDEINAETKRDLRQKILDVCSEYNEKKIRLSARKIANAEVELKSIDGRVRSAFMYRIFNAANEKQFELISNLQSENLTEEQVDKWLYNYYEAAKTHLEDKSRNYNYILNNDDIIKNTILKLIDDCYISFDEEGLIL